MDAEKTGLALMKSKEMGIEMVFTATKSKVALSSSRACLFDTDKRICLDEGSDERDSLIGHLSKW